MSSNHIPGKKIGKNLFSFSVNGDSFGDLLSFAGCKDGAGLSGAVPKNMKPPPYEGFFYEFKMIPMPLSDTRDLLAMVSGGQWRGNATLRELLAFLRWFPELPKKRSIRLVALGRDFICPLGGPVAVVKPGRNRFVLDVIESQQMIDAMAKGRPLWTPDDRFLVRVNPSSVKVTSAA